MLKITPNQLGKLKASRREAFCLQVATYLQEFYNQSYDRLGDAEEQREWIADVVEAAQSFGFDAQSEIYSYVRAAITFDEDFYQLPWAQAVLQTSALPATKALLLDDAVTITLEKEQKTADAERKRLLQRKALQYASAKANYVLAFDAFYGLGLVNQANAEQWLQKVAQQAIVYGFCDDFLLDGYTEVAMHYGPEFHQCAWATEILCAQSDATSKCQALLAHLSANYGQPNLA